jgi:hypothetical protein
VPAEKVASLNRQQRRRFIIARPSRTRIGTTPHFAAWKAEGRIKSILQRAKTVSLADQLEGSIAAAFALLSIGGYKNLWDISQSTVGALLRVRGIGPARLADVENYLRDKGVTLAWTVRD